jgi:hypothetical protein
MLFSLPVLRKILFTGLLGLGGMVSAQDAVEKKVSDGIEVEKPAKEEKPTAESVQKLLKKNSATEYELNGLRLDLQAGELRVPCKVKIIKGPLEYVLTTESGSAHETLFTTANSPLEIQVAMLLMGFKSSETYFVRQTKEDYPQPVKHPKIEPQSLFSLLVEHGEGEGKKVQPVEEWVKNLAKNTSLTPGPWVFTGSFFSKEGDLSAQISGNILSLYQDPVALANNPREGNELDDNWEPMPNLPATDSAVTIIFRKPKPNP